MKSSCAASEQFGRIAHVWSTYESRHHESDPEPFMRGINSIHSSRWHALVDRDDYLQHEI